MTNSITHDAMFAQLGRALHAWSNIETALSEFFSAIHGVAWQDNRHPLRAALESVVSLDARVAMIEASIHADDSIPVEYLDNFNSLKNKLIQQYKKRHKLAHFKMAVDWNSNEATIMPFYTMEKHMSQTQETLSISDIDLRLNRFHSLNVRVNCHSDYIRQLKGTPTQWPSPPEGLLQAIKAPPG
jgi:hypothetical protein